MRALPVALLVLMSLPVSGMAIGAPSSLAPEAVNGARFAPLPEPPSKTPSAVVLKAEVLLDRARFSPGSIDGVDGDNFRKAVAAYQAQAGLGTTGHLDQATWDRLTGADGGPVLVRREITKADVKGPFVKRIPAKFEAQAKLKHLGYADVREELSEQYHASPNLMTALNRAVRWTKPGSTVLVPQVVTQRQHAAVAKIVVDKDGHDVEAFGPNGKLVAFYPASIGSEEKPAPSGDFVIRRVIHNPDYTYNPKYGFKGVKATKPFTIAPGPNNPVGSVWMDLSYEGYGIHGTPQPDLVGKTQSHGCIRLANWDVEDLASMVQGGTPVSFQGGSSGPAAPAAQPVAPGPAAPVAPTTPVKP